MIEHQVHHLSTKQKMPNNLVFIFLVFHAIVCLVDREKKSELLPPQSINKSINESIFLLNLSHLDFHANGVGWEKKAQTSTQYTHGCCSHNVLSLLTQNIILQGFGAASANYKKHFPLSLSLSIAVHTTYLHVLGQ